MTTVFPAAWITFTDSPGIAEKQGRGCAGKKIAIS
jgi:hypothetical protein